MENITEIPGTLEIDHVRGVIYFHVCDPLLLEQLGQQTILRICHLPTPIPFPNVLLDITHTHGTSWK